MLLPVRWEQCGPSIEDGVFKVGVYAFGGPDGSTPAVFAFDSFTAESVPEPVSLGASALGAVLALRRGTAAGHDRPATGDARGTVEFAKHWRAGENVQD